MDFYSGRGRHFQLFSFLILFLGWNSIWIFFNGPGLDRYYGRDKNLFVRNLSLDRPSFIRSIWDSIFGVAMSGEGEEEVANYFPPF